MSKYWLSSLFFFFSLLAMAQPFDNARGNFNHRELELNPDFIRANGIRSLEVSYSRKLPGSPIEPLPDYDRFRFDAEGRKTSRLSIQSNRLGIDTVEVEWIYRGDGLVEMTGRDQLGAYRELTSNAEDGIRTTQWYRGQKLINQERIEISQIRDTLEIARHFNSDDIHYKTVQCYRRKDGRIHDETEEFLFSGRRNKTRFDYNDEGWVRTCYRQLGERQEHTTYEYSQLGEIMMVHYYSGNKVVETLEMLYDQGLPEAWISKEIETNRLKIAKFKFY